MFLTLLYIGRLHYSQTSREQILPINMVKENRLSAMLYGLKRSMWFLDDIDFPIKLPAKIGLFLEIERAKIGLNQLGLLPLLNTDVLNKNLSTGSPSDILSNLLKSKEVILISDMENALSSAQ